jgi:hypothetical protein
LQELTLAGAAAALKRKGKGDDVAEEQMEAVVRAHNSE